VILDKIKTGCNKKEKYFLLIYENLKSPANISSAGL